MPANYRLEIHFGMLFRNISIIVSIPSEFITHCPMHARMASLSVCLTLSPLASTAAAATATTLMADRCDDGELNSSQSHDEAVHTVWLGPGTPNGADIGGDC